MCGSVTHSTLYGCYRSLLEAVARLKEVMPGGELAGCLSGGTSEGKVANWKRRRATDETLSEQWNLQEAISIGSKVELVRWATVSGVLAVSACSLVTLLKEQPILADANADVVYQQGVCCIEADKLNFRTFQGTVKQTISMPEMEGDPMMLDINGSWMCVTNSNGFIRIYDLSARMLQVLHFQTYPSIMVWDADSDTVSNFNFIYGMTDQQKYEADADTALAAGQRPSTAAARFVLLSL
ncbi:unnamed protein product [Gongylonema pulchrum]|uniref:Nucleoporin_N domain-containing protein n=1 Tax=Gongylonema pulchrum TaxID=637853 RepID=A0A183ED62_9BILA|nr:unnamed protein product [Gongylonema pulchrum]